LILLQAEKGGGESLCFGKLHSWFFCYKLRHTKGGREGVFCSFVAAVEGQGKRERKKEHDKFTCEARTNVPRERALPFIAILDG
jgi:hypothetical protein